MCELHLHACGFVIGCRHSLTEWMHRQFFQRPAELGNAVQTDDLLFFVLGDAYQVRPAGQRMHGCGPGDLTQSTLLHAWRSAPAGRPVPPSRADVQQGPCCTGPQAGMWGGQGGPGGPLLVRRKGAALPAELDLGGALSPRVDWCWSTLLNLVIQTSFQLTVAACRSAPAAARAVRTTSPTRQAVGSACPR